MDTLKREDTHQEVFEGNDTTTVHGRVQARRRGFGHGAGLYRHRSRSELRDHAQTPLAQEGRTDAASGRRLSRPGAPNTQAR